MFYYVFIVYNKGIEKEGKKMKTLQIRQVAKLKEDVYNAYLSANNRQKDSYKLTLQMLNAFDDSVLLEVRGVNGGDIAEALLKVAMDTMTYDDVENLVYSYARSGRKDLDGKVGEVKYFGATNNTPNGTLKPIAFYSVSKFGVHHFTYEVVKKYFKNFKLDERKGTRAMTYSMMKSIVQNGEVKRIEKLSQALGL